MKSLFFNDLSEIIGITLLHSLWQGFIAVLLIILITRFVQPRYSTVRYWLYTAVLALVYITNLITLFVHQTHKISYPIANVLGLTNNANSVATLISSNGYDLTLTERLSSILPYFMMAWYIGIVFLFLRMALNLWYTRRMLAKNHIPLSDNYQNLFEKVKEKLAIKRLVKIVHSNKVDVPTVVGHLKPIILLPIGLISGLSLDQVESILLHELSHIKRHDYLINLLQSTLEVIYFFNPFIWIISGIIREEREHACDDTAISSGIASSVYAKTLATVFNYTVNKQYYTMNFTGRNKLTLKRIQRVMNTQKSNNKGNRLLTLLIFVLAITITMFYGSKYNSIVLANSDIEPLRIDAASVFPISIIEPVTNPNVAFSSKVSLDNKTGAGMKEVVLADTIKPKKNEKVDDYERALKKLKSSKEYKELVTLDRELVETQLEALKMLEPMMEEAIEIAEASLAFEEEEIKAAMSELAAVAEIISISEISEELERVQEVEIRAIEEAMRSIEVEMNGLELAEIESIAESIAEEANDIAREAELITMEVEKYTEHIDDFFDEIKPLLVKDGYIKSSRDLDSFKYRKEGIWVNGEEMDKKDLNRYIKIHDKYFDKDDDFTMN